MPDEREVTPDSLFNYLNLELQSNCNRSCWFCPRTYDTSGRYLDKDGKPVIKQMPTDKILGILDQAQEMGFRGGVSNHHLSEPLLDKRAIEIAWEIRKRGMFPIMNANGDILKHDEKLCRGVARVFEHVVIGIYDSTTKEGIEKEQEFWYSRLKGTKVYFSIIAPLAPDEIGLDKKDGAFPRTIVPFDSRMICERRTYPHGTCHRPLERLIIQYDGAVPLCCEDHMTQFDLGNALEVSIKEIWCSKKRLRIVRDLIAGHRSLYSLCSRCTMPPTSAPRGWEDYRDRY